MGRGMLDLALLLVLVVWLRESTAAAAAAAVSDSPVLPPVDVSDTVATESFKAVASNDSIDVSHSTDNNKITYAKQSIDIHEFADASEFTAESNAIASLRPTGQAGEANCRPVCSRKLAAESSRPVPSQVTNAMQAAELPPELGGNTDSSTNDLSAVVSNTEEPADGAMPSGHVTIVGSQAASADGVTNFARNTVIHGTLLDSSNVTSVDRNSRSPALVSPVSSNPNPASARRSPHQVDSITQSTTAATRYSGDNYAGGWQPDYATGFIPQTYPDYGGWDHNGSHPEEYGSFMPPTLPPVSSSSEWGTAALGMLSLFQDLCKLDHACDGTEWNALPTAHVRPCSECPLCFCDDECYDSNTCCMDRIINDFGQVVQTPHCYNRYFTDVKYSEYFLMVDDCPDTWQDQSVSSRCVNASISDLHGQWPVESSVTGSVYRNEHCARCHGEDETTLERWNLQVSCSKVTRLQNTSHLQDLVQEIRNTPGCHLAFEPPRYSRRRFCQPTHYPISSSCPRAHSLNARSLTLFERTCRMMFGDPPTANWTSVSPTNLVCALCNHEADGKTCERTDIDTPFPFMLLFSSKALQQVAEATGSVSTAAACGCGYDEVFDPYESRCRKLRCPTTRRIDKQRCKLVAEQSYGSSYQMKLRLTPHDVTQPPYVEDVTLLHETAWKWFEGMDQDAKLSQSFQVDLFTVVFYLEGSHNTETGPRSLLRPGFINNVEMEMKVVNYMLEDVQNLENKLFNLPKTRWTLPLTINQAPTVYDAAIIYSQSYVKADALSNISSDQSAADHVLLSSHGRYLEFPVNLTLAVQNYQLNNYIPSGRMIVDGYEPVQETLKCPAVSFLLTSPMATEGRDRDPPDHSQHSHSQTADRPGVARGRMLHSVDQDTGQVVVSLDTHTGTLHHKASGRTLSFQHVQLLQEDGVILVCSQQLYGSVSRPQPLVLHRLFSWHMIYVSVACQSLSVVCLFLVFFTYCVFGELRTLPGKNTLGLVTSLLLAMLLFEVGVARVEMPTVCTALGVVIHFCLLSAFTWMVICSAHMYRVFTHVLASRQDESEQTTSLFAKHVTVSLVLPALIVIGTMLGNWLGNGGCDLDLGYGRGICYLSNVWSLVLASVLPICIAVVVNLMLFGATVRSLRSVSRDLKMATRQQRQQLAVYVRMSTLTGINWLAGVMTAAVDSVAVWYIFIVLCGLQGFYVFIAFVCNKRVFSLYRARFRRSQTSEGRSRGDGHTEVTMQEIVTSSAPRDGSFGKME